MKVTAGSDWLCSALGTLLFLFVTLPCVQALEPPTPPNIIVILSDDMGFSDLGCYGGEIETPNLDALAKNGLRFTQFYNTARCCPTRASLLTGLYPHQAGMGHMTNDRGVDGYRGDLNNRCATIAEVLHDSGYRTYAIGKWHITRHDRPTSDNHSWPLQRGFDKYYGSIWGAASYFDPGIVRGNTWHSKDNDPEYKSENYYFTNALTDNAVRFLEQHEKESPDKPFFLYTAYTAAHWPMHALEKDIAKYKGRFDAGYDKLRKERDKRLREMGMLKPDWKMTTTAKNWDDVKDREWELRCMEVYAAMVDNMDQGIGRIVAELKRQKKFDNTVIFYMQDNGGCAEEIGRQPRKLDPAADAKLRPLRPDEITGGGHPKQTRDGRPMKSGPGVMPGGPDVYLGYGEGWANVSNTPFREYKHWVHEGGISTPLIVHWPARMGTGQRSKLVNDPSHLIDIMATCIDVAQTTYPAERKGEHLAPLQGVSLMAAVEGKPIARSQPLFWEHEGNRAVRSGKWKLVAKEDQPWELYDMEKDRTELHDLSKQHPELVKEFAAKWDAYAERSNVLPLGSWRNSVTSHMSEKGLRIKPGVSLGSEESPNVGNRTLTVTVELIEPKGDGILVAHGGTKHGYAFYVKEGKLCFDFRRDGKLSTIESGSSLSDALTTAVAVLDKDGNVQILDNGKEVGSKNGIGFLSRNPGDGLSTSRDSGDQVGKYPDNFEYKGKLGQILIQSGEIAKDGMAAH